ncbi:uncharacterized protein BDZ99DRAFT_519966 [Mytilinidion resinicola]|uniref:Uncharacterized protein n=1 Tax=Mytilinidion resinicola TaxID=574789 RepID=A0A6A6YMU2_9PEZI|nr:uncharacterized protein BDZ99DRAFT_519966 [Mytilinidion resinicola]KAF2809868.1 hypothetical protein BDZ99DRAFT_519966 [Mytilinidion resinicola]
MNQQASTARALPKLKVSHWPHIIYCGNSQWAELECYRCHGNGSTGNGTHAFKFFSGLTALGIHLSLIHGVELAHDEIKRLCTTRALSQAALLALLNGTSNARPVEKRVCEMMTVEEKMSLVTMATRDEIDADFAAMGISVRPASVNPTAGNAQTRDRDERARTEAEPELSATDSDEAQEEQDANNSGDSTNLEFGISEGEASTNGNHLNEPTTGQSRETEDDEIENNANAQNTINNEDTMDVRGNSDEEMTEANLGADENNQTDSSTPDVAVLARAFRYTDYSLRQRKK